MSFRGGMSVKSVCRFFKTKRILGVASALAITFATPAIAEEEKTRNFSIEAQPLAMALVEFSRQSDITVIAPSKTTRGLQSRAVVGEMEPAEALEALLGEADLELRTRRDRAIILAQVSEESAPIREMQIEDDAGSFAVAEDEGDVFQQLEEIVVTGTNIRGVENPTVPVIQFDQLDIELSGAVTIEDFLRIIPQNFGGVTPLSSDSSNDLAPFTPLAGTGIDLRGIGAGSTLTLLNGRRMSASGNGSFVDVSVLPISAIERVDVLTDGASAIYGTDAVAGVVNFVTRRDFEGFEVSGQYGGVTDGATESINVAAAGGTSWDTGNAVFGLEFVDTTPLRSTERDFFDQDLVNPNGTIGVASERLSMIGTLEQEITDRLSFGVDTLFSARDTDSTENAGTGDQLQFRSEQDSLFINSRLEYEVNDYLFASFFYDYAREDGIREDSSDSFENPNEYTNEIQAIELQLSGSLFDLPSGKHTSFAIGGAFRQGEFTFENENEKQGPFEREVYSVYGELLLPLIGAQNELPLVKQLDISLAGRFEDYSDFGDTFNPKVGVSLSPSNELTVRGSYSSSFRAPTLRDSFLQEIWAIGTLPNFFITAFPPPPQSAAAPDGQTILAQNFGGNENLEEETADIWSAGFEYSPAWANGLTFTATYFDISYEDRVETVSSFSALSNSELAEIVILNPDPVFIADIIARGEAGEALVFNGLGFGADDVQLVLNGGLLNVAKRNVEGLDFSVDYRISGNFGDIAVTANAAYLLGYDGQLTSTSTPFEDLDTLYRPLDFRMRGGLSWVRNGLTVAAFVNHADGYQDLIDESQAASIGSWTTFDLSFAYDTGQHFDAGLLNDIRVSLSIRNTFDEDPPFVQTIDGFNYDPTNADPLGRYITIGVNKSF